MDDSIDKAWLLAKFTASIRVLASNANEQIAYLEALGTAPSADELALELDDVAGACEPFLEPLVRYRVNALLQQFDSMDGPKNPALWHTEALHSSSAWAEVRSLAVHVLEAITLSVREEQG